MTQLSEKTITELERLEWGVVHIALKDAQAALERGSPAGRYSWLDAPVSLALERSNGVQPVMSRQTLTEEIVRGSYHHFMKDAEAPCSASAMREAIELAIKRMAPAFLEVAEFSERLNRADYGWVKDNWTQAVLLIKDAAKMLERLLAGSLALPVTIVWKPGENYRFIGGVKHYRNYEAYVDD